MHIPRVGLLVFEIKSISLFFLNDFITIPAEPTPGNINESAFESSDLIFETKLFFPILLSEYLIEFKFAPPQSIIPIIRVLL